MTSQLQFLRPYLRGWIIILGSMVIAYLAAAKYLSYATPMYQSTAKLKLADHNEGVPNSNLYKDFDLFATTQKIKAEIELIKSDAILKKALRKVPYTSMISRVGQLKNTELFTDAPIIIDYISVADENYGQPILFDIKSDSTYTATLPNGHTLEGLLQDTLTNGSTQFIVSLNDTLLQDKGHLKWHDHYEAKILNDEQLLAYVRSGLDVSSVDKDVPIIRIIYKSAHPEKAALLPNALAQAYIEDYIETRYGAADLTVNFLGDRIKEVSGKLEGAERAMLNYREKNSITNLRQETETDLRKVSQLKIQQTNLKMSLDAIRDLEGYIQEGQGNFLELAPNFEAFTDLLSTEMVKKIKQLQAEKKDLLLEYTPRDERVKVVNDKIEDLTSYLIESIKNTRKNLESKYRNLTADITVAEKTFIPVPEKERVMTILGREFDLYQQSYNFLNKKQIEAEIAKAAKMAFHRVITPSAVSKEPVSPNFIIIKGVSVILGLIGAILLIFIVHSSKARINDISTIEANSLIPIAARIPKLKGRIQTQNHFVKLLTQWQVKQLMTPNGILCFTAYDPRHGQSYISTQVIKTLKNQGKKLLVVSLHSDTHTDLHTTSHKDANETHLCFNTDQMPQYDMEAIQLIIADHSKNYDQTILINSSFDGNYTLAMMQSATLNLICVDTRLTPARRVEEIDLLMDEYKLPGIHFAVNRNTYNPSFIAEMCGATRRLIRNTTKIKQQ